MIKESEELLLKDLCARLPYHVRCKIWLKDGTTEEGPLDLEHNYADVLLNAFYYNNIKDIKPYLRPISSMTEEEHVDFYYYHYSIELEEIKKSGNYLKAAFLGDNAKYDWLNKHHFDYRYLIERGLAIEVTKENNPYEN